MVSRIFWKNECAVSISLGFILMFSITVLVFSGLMISFNTLSSHSQETAMRVSFDIMGNGIAAKVISMDTLVNITKSNGGTINQLEYNFSIPASISNKDYNINITSKKMILEAENGAKSWIPLNSSNPINEQIYSNARDFTFWYDTASNSIKIK